MERVYRSLMVPLSDGWTGTVVVDVGGSTYTVTPAAVTSAVELLDRLVRAGARRGGTWSWYVSSDGFVTITSTVTFALTLTGTTRTRLGLTGSYSGAITYTAADPLYQAAVPTLGIAQQGAEGVARGGGVTQAEPGEFAATGLAFSEDSGSLRFWGDRAEMMDLETTLEDNDVLTWDVALGCSWTSRVRITGMAREPWGRDPTRSALAVSVVAVSQ